MSAKLSKVMAKSTPSPALPALWVVAVVAVLAASGCVGHARPAKVASAADRVADLDWLLAALARDDVYLPAGFDVPKLRAHYLARARAAGSRGAWIAVLEDVLGELHDHHVSLGTNTDASPRLVPTGADLWGDVTDGRAVITAVRRGTAAERAGLRVGMEVTEVGGVPIAVALAHRLPAITGTADPEAASWALRVLLAGTHDRRRRLTACTAPGRCQPYELEAPELPEAEVPVTARLIPSSVGGGAIGYLRIENSLGDDATVAAFDAALGTLASARGLILDLRNTPSGGSTEVAEPILGRLIAAPAGYQQVFVPGHDARPWTKQLAPRAPHEARPLVVLVDRWTGSMAEGMAIGLDALGRATVIGTPMSGLRGGISSVTLPHSGISVRFPTERLAHVDGTPRERWRPRIVVEPVGGEPEDPILARGVAELAR